MASQVHVEVRARDKESFDSLMRRFVKKVKKEKLIDQFRELRYYEKPSITRAKKRDKKKYLSQRSNKESKQ